MTLAVSLASRSPRRFFVWMAVALALGVLWHPRSHCADARRLTNV